MTQMNSNNIPLISVVVPVFNEQSLLEEHLERILAYLKQMEGRFCSEVIIVNDGSRDQSAEIANRVADRYANVFAIHHPRNFGLGQALNFGFRNTKGEYVVTLDIDLSYDVEHIGQVIAALQNNKVKMVLMSPYAAGGAVRNVPWFRRTLSRWGNRFLSFFVKGRYSTLTSVMRGFDGPFIRSLNLRAMGMDVMPEMIYKAAIMQASYVEVPATLDWAPQLEYVDSRISSMRVVRQVFATIFSSFIFRPFLFFVIPGILMAAFSLYVNVWMFIHYFDSLAALRAVDPATDWSAGLALAYQLHPHTFIFGLLTAMLSVQLIGLGVLSVQSKHYFEELFHLGSSSLRRFSGFERRKHRSDVPGADPQKSVDS